jgi:hypothetical protein
MLYEAEYPKGTVVKVASRQDLEKFREGWRLHHPLEIEQLEFADQAGPVSSVGYYHGGDVLYQIEGIPGIWHECCLRPAVEGPNSN